MICVCRRTKITNLSGTILQVALIETCAKFELPKQWVNLGRVDSMWATDQGETKLASRVHDKVLTSGK